MRAGFLVGAVLVFQLAGADSEKLVYNRSDALTVVTGEASFQRAYTRQLTLPSEKCDGAPFSCTIDRMYGQVYSVAFVEETLSRGADLKPATSRRDRGRVLIAVSFPKEAENRFEDSLTTYLERLGVAAYSRPHAGLDFLEGPLSQRALSQTDTYAWVCTEEGDRCACDHLVFDNDHNSIRSYSAGGPRGEACRAIEGAAADASPTVYRTMPDVREEMRWTVQLASVSSLDGSTWANRLVELPANASLKKSFLGNGKLTGGMRDEKNGVFVGHEGRYGGVERSATIPHASLDLAGLPMWITKWTIDAERAHYGTDPRTEPEATFSLLVAVAPISDPVMRPQAQSRRDLSAPTEALTTAAIDRVQRSASPRPSAIVEAFGDPRIWPPRGDWIIVTCTDDGKARYGIAPFVDAAPVDNAREACAAIRTALGD